MTPRNRLVVTAALGAAILSTAWAYAPALHAGFQFDDEITITHNAAIKDLGAFLRRGFLRGFRGDGRPVTELSFALDYARTRLEPLPLHLTNLAIHLAATLLAFAVARELFRRAGSARPDLPAAAAAALFALHPLQAEAVSYLCQRAESLAAALYLASLGVLLAAERRPWRWRGALLHLGSLALFALAMGAKPIASTLPLAFLLCAFGLEPAGSGSRRRALRAAGLAAPYLLLTALSTLIHLRQFHGRADVGFDMARVTTAQYVLTQPRAILAYLRLALWPAGLSVDHAFPLSRGLDLATVGGLAGLGVVVASSFGLVAAGRRRSTATGQALRLAGFGLLWFLVVLLPTSSVIPLADVMVEHRVYLPLFGLAVAAVALAGAALERLPAPTRHRAGLLAALAACAALAVALERRNHVWSSPLSAWADATAKAPAKRRPRANYALALFSAGRNEEAVAEYRRALAAPDDGSIEPYKVHANVATALGRLGRHAEAAREIEGALAQRPGDPHLLNDLAISLMDQGRSEEALSYARRALAASPSFGGALNTLGQLLMDRGDYGAALAQFQGALRENPDFAPALYNLAHVLVLLDRVGEACEALERYRHVPEAFAQDALQNQRALGCPAVAP